MPRSDNGVVVRVNARFSFKRNVFDSQKMLVTNVRQACRDKANENSEHQNESLGDEGQQHNYVLDLTVRA